jgi:hypothetical protein
VDTATPKIVMEWDSFLPNLLPARPTSTEPIRGARTIVK